MIEKIIKTPKFEEIQVGETEQKIYISDDGREFANPTLCERYENVVKKGKDHFTELLIDYEQLEAILKLCFYAHGLVNDINLILWKSTKDINKIKESIDYLRSIGIYINISTLQKLKEHKLYAIASWIEDYNSDSSTWEYGIIEYDELKNTINKLLSDITI